MWRHWDLRPGLWLSCQKAYLVYLSFVVDIAVFLPVPFYTVHSQWCICRYPYLCLSSNTVVWWDDKFSLFLGDLIYHGLQQVLWNARIWGWLMPQFLIWVHNMLVKKTLICMNVSNSWKGALPLSRHFEMHLPKGSVLCISWNVLVISGERWQCIHFVSVWHVLTSVGCVLSVGLCVLLWVRIAGPSGVVVTNILMEAVEATGVSLISTNHEKQSSA